MHLPKEVPTDSDNDNYDEDQQHREELDGDLEALVVSAADVEEEILRAIVAAGEDPEANAETLSQLAESLEDARELKQWARAARAATAAMQPQP
jgi:hypothetical protein